VAILTFAPSAVADANDILELLRDRAGVFVAEAYLSRFEATYDRLARFPDSGAPRPRLGRSVRIAVVKPYVVIYRSSGEAVEVMRILHGRRDIRRAMRH
jgi:toxin ParE1/3/4